MRHIKIVLILIVAIGGVLAFQTRAAVADGCCLSSSGSSCATATQAQCSAPNTFDSRACNQISQCQSTGPTAPASSTPSSTTSSAGTSAPVQLPNPISCGDATCLVTNVIRYILGTIAIIATLMFIWGGVMMLTSAGNADQVKRAKETLVWASIGVIVILLSWGIIRFVLTAITTTTK